MELANILRGLPEWYHFSAPTPTLLPKSKDFQHHYTKLATIGTFRYSIDKVTVSQASV